MRLIAKANFHDAEDGCALRSAGDVFEARAERGRSLISLGLAEEHSASPKGTFGEDSPVEPAEDGQE